MKSMREIKTGNSEQQRGAVLIVALVMLLLLTLLGIAAIRDSQLQERMAGGTEDRAIAFQAAESALRQAESLIAVGTCTGSCAANGYYGELVPLPIRDTDGVSGGGTPVSENVFWTSHFSADGADASYWDDVTKVKTYAAPLLPNVTAQPRYVIELLPGNFSGLPNTTNAGVASTTPCTSEIKDYLITTRATGRTASSVVILQSRYRHSTATAPCP